MPIDFNGSGLVGPYEECFQISDFRGRNQALPYVDIYDLMESNSKRCEITGIMVPPIVGAQTTTEYANVDVTLFGEPKAIHHILTLRAGEIHRMRVRRIWTAGCTNADNIRLFGIMV